MPDVKASDILKRKLEQFEAHDEDVFGSNSTYRPELDEALSLRLRRAAGEVETIVRFLLPVIDSMPVNDAKLALAAIDATLIQIGKAIPDKNVEPIFSAKIDEITRQLYELRTILPMAIVCSADKLLPRYEHKLTQLTDQAEKTLKSLEDRIRAALEQIDSEAQAKIAKARQTARGISVADAQEQFKVAATALQQQARLWVGAAAVMVVAFFAFAGYLMNADVSGDSSQLLYRALIRVTILSAIAALASFCLRMVRSHLHMLHTNRHRQSLANSMAALIEAGETAQQRDMTLNELIRVLVEFGDSGLLDKGNSDSSQKIMMPAETLRVLTKAGG